MWFAKGVEHAAKGLEYDLQSVEYDSKGEEYDSKGVEYNFKGVEGQNHYGINDSSYLINIVHSHGDFNKNDTLWNNSLWKELIFGALNAQR